MRIEGAGDIAHRMEGKEPGSILLTLWLYLGLWEDKNDSVWQ